jgi:hypothetical protein
VSMRFHCSSCFALCTHAPSLVSLGDPSWRLCACHHVHPILTSIFIPQCIEFTTNRRIKSGQYSRARFGSFLMLELLLVCFERCPHTCPDHFTCTHTKQNIDTKLINSSRFSSRRTPCRAFVFWIPLPFYDAWLRHLCVLCSTEARCESTCVGEH